MDEKHSRDIGKSLWIRAGKVQFSSVQSLFFLNLNLNLLLQGRTEPEPEPNLPELVLLGSVLVQNWFKPEPEIHIDVKSVFKCLHEVTRFPRSWLPL